MGYQLGVDLGTTYTAAAVGRDGRAEVGTLGASSPVMPSVVLLRADGEVLVGEVAVRRGLAEPTRVAREFKRRLGDPTPLVLGGTPYGAESLMGHLLRDVVRTVSQREGEAPERVVLTHPANYGPYKLDMMREVARLAGLDLEHVAFLSEPEAAAISYASRNRVEPGEVVAIYDFGGGTFDAALVRRNADGFELIGRPDGMERFGGIDIDAAIVAHIDQALDGALAAMDPEDPAVLAGVARLRDDCRAAKEALSGDTDTTVSVSLPNLQTEVRLTRVDLEEMVRPRLRETVEAVNRAVTSAGLTMDQVSRILLVGGSSRIPLVADAIRRDTGRPVAIDAHPKFAIAFGAALYDPSRTAAAQSGSAGASADKSTTTPPPSAPPIAPLQPASSSSSPGSSVPPPPPPPSSPASSSPASSSPASSSPASSSAGSSSPGSPSAALAGVPEAPATRGAAAEMPPRPGSSTPPPKAGISRTLVLALGAGALVIAAVVVFLVVRGGGSSETFETVASRPPRTTDTTPDQPASTVPDSGAETTASVAAQAITGDDLRGALITATDIGGGWVFSSPGDSGDDLCGQLPQKQPVNRANTGFSRTNEAGVNQFMTNAIEVYDSPASADIEFEHEVSVVQNCTDGSQTINGIKVAEVMSALRAPADLMKSFPGCEKGVTVLIHSTAPEVQFDNNTSVWYMRCGNVLTSISVDQPSSADGADATSQMVIGAQAGFARVSRLPLSH